MLPEKHEKFLRRFLVASGKKMENRIIRFFVYANSLQLSKSRQAKVILNLSELY